MALAQVYQFPPIEASPKVATVKRPSFQFYPADWRKDPALAACSLAARGLWMELLCIAHESERYGFLSINGKAMTPAQLARIVGETPALVTKLLREIEEAGVLSRSEDGIIFSRRMVRDEELRNIRAANGVKGAEHGKKGASHGVKGGRPAKTSIGEITPLETPQDVQKEPSPSSSSSSSINSVAEATGGKPPKITDPAEIIFGYGLSMLVNAGTAEKQARSFLGGLRKAHGDDALIDKLRDCAKAKPLQPLEWLAAALPPPASGGSRAPKSENFDAKDYGSGVEAL
ncbi:hypothetical protein [Comamonas sp. 4034]|uniref:hypothetical protein n=1 Tax=Comamonas sp. 4034 TaxID=3156455 RepID=UPI003D19FBF7